MEPYRISEHEKRSTLAFKPFISKDPMLELWAKFNLNCLYSLRYSEDLNKLAGISLQMLPFQLNPFQLAKPHHINSIRVAWRPGEAINGNNPQHINLYSYIYDHGVFYYHFLKSVKPSEPFYVKMYLGRDTVVFKDKNGMLARVKSNFINSLNHKPFWGYHLYPYFGGDRPSPKKMTICLNYALI